jgi:predicted N-formylglutamate amidohydrolase
MSLLLLLAIGVDLAQQRRVERANAHQAVRRERLIILEPAEDRRSYTTPRGMTPPGRSSSIPAVSEATSIPGNIGLDAAEAQRRCERWFEPFHDAVTAHLNARIRKPTAFVGIHTFTPVFHNAERPWHAGVLFNRTEEFGLALALAIETRCAGLVGRNKPYRIEIDEDYTVPVHGDARGLAAALIEVRQDLVSNVFNIEQWSRLLARALASVTHLVGTGES